MRWALRLVCCVAIFVAGYGAAWLPVSGTPDLRAQSKSDTAASAVHDRVRDADRALADAMQALQDEKLYVPAIAGLNAFAVSVGGVDAVADLESGQGVDPETFAGLYAGQALPELSDRFSRDAEGRLTYRNKVVRMYNATRVKQLFAARLEYVPLSAGGTKKAPTGSKKEKDGDQANEKAKDE
jgi:hypothetical protein